AGRMNVSSCPIVGLRNSGAVSRTKSFQNWPGASSTSGGVFSRINASSKPCASSVPVNDSSTTKTTRSPRSSSTRPMPTQLFVGPYAPSGKKTTVTSRERLLEVGPELVRVLEPDAQAKQPRRHAVALPAGAALEHGLGA